MGVDYLARKGAKKNRKRMNVKPRRERKKKNVQRRLCRGLCYQEPGLSPEDLQEEGGEEGQRQHDKSLAAAGEMSRFKKLLAEKVQQEKVQQEKRQGAEAGANGDGRKAAKGGRAAGGEEGGVGKAQKQKKKKKRPQPAAVEEEAPAGSEDAEGAGAAGEGAAAPSKRLKLSTSVNLLDAKKAARSETPRQAQRRQGAGGGEGAGVPAGASEALARQPELIRRFMGGEGLAEPMPVQERCWPLLLAGRDVEVVAEPGAGKTLGYLLPGAVRLGQAGHGAGSQPESPPMLVVLPTRELAQQVAATCRALRKYSGLRSVCLTGGLDKGEQVAALGEKRPHIVVATPGRLLDLAEEGSLGLGGVRYVVLDEADKMLGMGFQPQIDRLKALLLPPTGAGARAKEASAKSKRHKRAAAEAAAAAGEQGGAERPQVALFTATMPASVAEVAMAWLRAPELVQVSHSAASISRTVTQVVQVCAEHKKPAKLAKHLAAIQAAAQGLRNPPRVLIFANRIKTVRFLHQTLGDAGYRAAMLHGERSQEEREAAMHDFRSGKVQVLVATDVAARGLHIRGLPYVVNYDFPPNLEQYIHRAGRTGRLAADGHAFSFFTREMAPLAGPLLELLRAHEQAMDPNLVKLAEAYQLAAERLGLLNGGSGGGGEEEEGDGEEGGGPARPARPQTDDVLRTLGLRTKQERKKKKQEKRARQEEPFAGSEGGSDEEEGGEPARGVRRQAQPAAAAAGDDADAGEGQPFFSPSKAFKGARPGYAFKKGMKGLGYYLDPVQQQRQRQQSQQPQQGRSGQHAAQHKQQHQQQLKEKYARAPVGGPADGLARADKGASRGKPSSDKPGKAGRALLPGQLWRQKGAAAQDGGEELDDVLDAGGASGSDAEEGAGAAATSKRKRALPGRIRKKLAAQRQQQ